MRLLITLNCREIVAFGGTVVNYTCFWNLDRFVGYFSNILNKDFMLNKLEISQITPLDYNIILKFETFKCLINLR